MLFRVPGDRSAAGPRYHPGWTGRGGAPPSWPSIAVHAARIGVGREDVEGLRRLWKRRVGVACQVCDG